MADVDMDDMDIDLSLDDPEIARLNAETAAMDAQADMDRTRLAESEAMTGVEEPPEDGEVDGTEAAPTKVYIRGLDNLTSKDLKAYVHEHGVADLFKNVQWIDDTSANLVYDSERAAEDALLGLSTTSDVTDPRQLRAAKSLSTHPDCELEVRQATLADVKVQRAALYSRFYLDHPEYDPENRHAKRRRDGDGRRGRNERSKRSRSERWEYRDPSPNAKPFDENLYDDGAPAVTSGRRGSEDLFAGKKSSHLRGRSASPIRDEDGRYGFEESQPRRRTARYRSRTPPDLRDRQQANRSVQQGLRKELFPDKADSSGSMGVHGDGMDLFPVRNATPKAVKDLFPDKVTPTAHRRREARDLHPNEVASAIGKCHISSGGPAFAYSSAGRRPDNADRRPRNGGRDLFARITGDSRANSEDGRLSEPDGSSTGFSFKNQSHAADYSILGASSARNESAVIKELFPGKARTEGQDLFDGTIKGRANRRRAEDLF